MVMTSWPILKQSQWNALCQSTLILMQRPSHFPIMRKQAPQRWDRQVSIYQASFDMTSRQPYGVGAAVIPWNVGPAVLNSTQFQNQIFSFLIHDMSMSGTMWAVATVGIFNVTMNGSPV